MLIEVSSSSSYNDIASVNSKDNDDDTDDDADAADDDDADDDDDDGKDADSGIVTLDRERGLQRVSNAHNWSRSGNVEQW